MKFVRVVVIADWYHCRRLFEALRKKTSALRLPGGAVDGATDHRPFSVMETFQCSLFSMVVEVGSTIVTVVILEEKMVGKSVPT